MLGYNVTIIWETNQICPLQVQTSFYPSVSPSATSFITPPLCGVFSSSSFFPSKVIHTHGWFTSAPHLFSALGTAIVLSPSVFVYMGESCWVWVCYPSPFSPSLSPSSFLCLPASQWCPLLRGWAVTVHLSYQHTSSPTTGSTPVLQLIHTHT